MADHQSKTRIAAIILCAGKGRRMQAPRTPKVCFPVAGKTAILHTLDNLRGLGSSPNILVVGHLAGMVVEEVGPHFPDSLFAYQANLAGTGHAARQGAAMLDRLGFTGAVLVLAGDKLVEPRTLHKLVAMFEAESADAALVVAPKTRWPDAGRIITDDDGNILRIIEKADLENAKAEGRHIEIRGHSFSPDEVEARVHSVNQAVYLYRAPVLFDALQNLNRQNVQQEEYLTDTIDYLVKQGKRVIPVSVDNPEDVLGFNNPTELLEIEEHFRRKLSVTSTERLALDPSVFKAPEEWVRRLADTSPHVNRMLRAIYGDNPSLCEEKRIRLQQTIRLFIERFGSEGEVAVIRAPGRVNMMGRHVDHRGGRVNLMAIDREHILVARRRGDTTVRACNADAHKFEDLEFTMEDLLRQVRLDDWREFVDSEAIIQMVRDLQGNWGNYIKASMLRLQQQFKDRRILGMDCVVSGDIPMAAGLSSSSALVVASAEAFVLVNGLDVEPTDMVDLCGEGEWFVGTRGGSADHAAVKLSQFGRVANVGFFPFNIHQYIDFPNEYKLVICNSRIEARKAHGAREAFNERVASYELAVQLVRKRFPNYAPLISHLRDISPEALGIRSADIYRILLDIPETASARELAKELGANAFDRIVAMHTPSDHYALRNRLLFGVSECERSKRCIEYLKDGDMVTLGWLMNVSHDGDRVVTRGGVPFSPPQDDAFLRGRIEDLQSENPKRVLAAQLYAQSGSYACSTPEIDQMVDIALASPGVLGAQLSGAGLGGCMMVLTRDDAADAVIGHLNERYYEPNDLEPGAAIFIPIAGCCPLTLER